MMPMTAPAMPAPTCVVVPCTEQLADALKPGERRAGPDDRRDPDPGQVLGPLQAIGVTLAGGPPRQPETEEHHRAGGDIGQVMDRIAEQPDRARQHRQQQLDQAGGAQADGADRHRPVRRPPVPGIITGIRQGKRRSGITQPRGLMHRARITLCLMPGQIWSCTCSGAALLAGQSSSSTLPCRYSSRPISPLAYRSRRALGLPARLASRHRGPQAARRCAGCSIPGRPRCHRLLPGPELERSTGRSSRPSLPSFRP